MAVITKSERNSITYKLRGQNPSEVTLSHDGAVMITNTPPKVNGTLISLPVGGGKFRRSTAYSRSEVKLSPGSAQNFSESQKVQYLNQYTQTYARSSPGGYTSEVVINADAGFLWKNDSIGLLRCSNTPTIPTQRRNEAVTKALLKIADQKVGMGENMAQFLQTLKLLSDPVRNLGNIIKAVQREKSFHKYFKMNARQIRKNVWHEVAARRYLEYVYGWKPLMQDIHGIIELAKESGTKKPLILRGTGTSKVSTQNPDWTHTHTTYKTRASVSNVRMKSRVGCTLWAQIDPDNSGLRTLNQLNLINPLALSWELMKYSFVIDWILPIGPVLNALTAPMGLIFVDGSISNRVSASCDYENYWAGLENSDYPIKEKGSKASGNAVYEGYTRGVIRSWPLPGLWIDNDPMRGDRPLKALALFISSLARY